jgi:hypothetical protein
MTEVVTRMHRETTTPSMHHLKKLKALQTPVFPMQLKEP